MNPDGNFETYNKHKMTISLKLWILRIFKDKNPLQHLIQSGYYLK